MLLTLMSICDIMTNIKNENFVRRCADFFILAVFMHSHFLWVFFKQQKTGQTCK